MTKGAATRVKEKLATDETETRYDFRFTLGKDHRERISETLGVSTSEAGEQVYITLEVFGTEAQGRKIAARTAGRHDAEAWLREALWATGQGVNLDELMDEKLPEAAEEYSNQTGSPHRVKKLTDIDIPTLANLLETAADSSWERYGKDWSISLTRMTERDIDPEEIFQPAADGC